MKFEDIGETIKIQLEENDIKDLQGVQNKFDEIVYKLYIDCDCMIVGEAYCLSNYDIAIDMYYNGDIETAFRFDSYDLDDLLNGVAVEYKKHDIEYIEEYLMDELDN